MPKNAFIKQILSVMFILLFIPALALSQQGGKSVKEIATEIKNTKDVKQRQSLFQKLRLQSPSDIDELVSAIKTTKDKDDKNALLGALQNVKEEDKQLTDAYIKLLDSNDKEIRIASISGIGKLKAKAAAPRLREIVKGFGKVDYLKFKTLEGIDPVKSIEVIEEAGTAAQALGEIKDEDAIPLLAEKYDVLRDFATMALAKIGKKAIPALLELARKETDPFRHDSPAQGALFGIDDIEAKPELINILRTEKNNDIRMRVLDGLIFHFYDDEVMQVSKELYLKEKDTFLLDGLKTPKATPFLIDLLRENLDYDPSTAHAVISLLRDIGDPSAIPILEDALNNRDRGTKLRAVEALKKITGKDYEWKK